MTQGQLGLASKWDTKMTPQKVEHPIDESHYLKTSFILTNTHTAAIDSNGDLWYLRMKRLWTIRFRRMEYTNDFYSYPQKVEHPNLRLMMKKWFLEHKFH